MAKETTVSSTKTARQSSVKSNASAFEKQLLNKAVETRESKTTRLSIDFLKTIKEVTARRSQYDADKCFARISFKDGKHSSVPLDFEVPAEPGDKLRLSTLQWKILTNEDGEEFTCLTGDVQ